MDNNKQHTITWRQTKYPSDDGYGMNISPILSGGHLIEWLYKYDEISSLKKTKNTKKILEELRDEFYRTSKQIDFLMDNEQRQYEIWKDDGIPTDDIVYDEDEIYRDRVSYWDRMFQSRGLNPQGKNIDE